jgi:hypothetical protein
MNYTQYFENKTRNDGKRFVCLKDDAPIELQNLIHDIHDGEFYGCLPNDWIYSMIWEAFSALKEDDIENVSYEADIYNHDLANWFAENCNQYANEISATLIMDDCFKPVSAVDLFSNTQYEAKRRIYYAVADFLKEREEVQE